MRGPAAHSHGRSAGKLVFCLYCKIDSLPHSLPVGLRTLPLGLGETVHSTPSPAISHKSGPSPSPRPPVMSPKLRWQPQERPKASLSLFQKNVPIGPQKFIPRRASLLGKLTHLSELGGRDSSRPQQSRDAASGRAPPGALGRLVPTFFPRNVYGSPSCWGYKRAGRRQTQPDLLRCPLSGEGDDRHHGVRKTLTLEFYRGRQRGGGAEKAALNSGARKAF